MPDDEPHTGALERPRALPHITAARRSPPYRPRGFRNGNRPAALASREQDGLGAVSFGHFGGIGFDSMAAFPTPDDEPNMAAAAPPSVIGGPGSDFT